MRLAGRRSGCGRCERREKRRAQPAWSHEQDCRQRVPVLVLRERERLKSGGGGSGAHPVEERRRALHVALVPELLCSVRLHAMGEGRAASRSKNGRASSAIGRSGMPAPSAESTVQDAWVESALRERRCATITKLPRLLLRAAAARRAREASRRAEVATEEWRRIHSVLAAHVKARAPTSISIDTGRLRAARHAQARLHLSTLLRRQLSRSTHSHTHSKAGGLRSVAHLLLRLASCPRHDARVGARVQAHTQNHGGGSEGGVPASGWSAQGERASERALRACCPRAHDHRGARRGARRPAARVRRLRACGERGRSAHQGSSQPSILRDSPSAGGVSPNRFPARSAVPSLK